MDWYKLSVEEATQELNTDIKAGLTPGEIEQRQQQYGPNELVDRGGKNPWLILLRQFTEVLIIILIIAALISIFLGEYIDATVILLIVILTGVLGFVQEMRAEQSMAALKKLAVPQVRVRRSGHLQEIPSTQLVPGDLILLEAGNLVPADSRVVESINLKVQEAALTGESEPVEKGVAVPSGDNLAVGDQRNMLFMGTVVTYGRGEAVVVETGMNTELGNIAELIQDVEDEQTPLQRRLDGLGKTLAWVALAIIAVVIILGWFRGEDLELLFLTGVSLAVAAIPESLPAIVTITLALGSQKLLKRNALIRNLPAVETLGSVTVICSDKTGTLTENRMTVTVLDVAGNTQDLTTLVSHKGVLLEADFMGDTSPELNALSVLVRAGALCNDAVLESENGVVRAIGDPTEGALVLAAKQLGYDKTELEAEWPRVAEVPFTSERKRMTTVHKMSPRVQETDLPWRDTPYVLLSKGAVDSLLQVTDRVLVDNQLVPLDESLVDRIMATNAQFAQQGQRVLGVAFRFWDSPELPNDDQQLEENEVFVGLIAMIDPPRPEVKESVAVAKTAGIRPIMITGDHPLTAQQIAKDLGITDNDRHITGQELARMPLSELEKRVEDVSVYARVAPEHKLNIVDALQNNGEIVSMTGDGVNDAPALKQADIGVAMGITGTDVSKEASDMVLLDDNFSTIVAAVEEGRVIYDNIRKFIKYALSSNTGELFLMLVGPLVGMPLPLLPLQILWINLVTDGLPGIALAEEPAEPGVMKRPPFHPQESIFSRGVGIEIIWIGGLVGVISLGIGFWSWQQDAAGPWQTMIFTSLVLAQMGNVLAIRSNRESLFKIGILSNRFLLGAVLLTIVLQLIIVYVPLFQGVFATEPLSASNLLICFLAGVVVFAAVEIYKWILRRRD